MEALPEDGLGGSELKIPIPELVEEIINNPDHEWA